MRRSDIERENQSLLERQRNFRAAADRVTEAWMQFPDVRAIAVIGSVAKPLWKEVPRFREYRGKGIALWHECGDLDLAVWLDTLENLDALRRARDLALREMVERGATFGIVGHQVDTFLFEPGFDRYLGRLCSFNQCPKGKRDCLTPSCGAAPFNKRIDGFLPGDDLLSGAVPLYERMSGRRRNAVDLPEATDDGAVAP